MATKTKASKKKPAAKAKKTKPPVLAGTSSEPLQTPTIAPITQPEAPAKLTQDEVIARVEGLIWKHGANIQEWANYGDLLAEVGLAHKQVNKGVFKAASESVKKRLDGTIHWLDPVEETTETGKIQVWKTKDNHYRIVRAAEAADPRFLAIARVNGVVAGKEKIIKNDLRGLRVAQEAVQRYHVEVMGKEILDCNAEAMEEAAKRAGLDKIRSIVRDIESNGQPTTKEKPVKEKKTNAPTELDNYGSKIGSKEAQFNTILTKEPKKMGVLLKLAGLTSTFYNHANKLVEQGILEKSDLGYALKGN